jgi:hypothetical protein
MIHKWHLKLEFTSLATSLTFGLFMLDNGGVHGSCLNFLRSIALIKCVPLLKTWHFYTSNRGSYVDHVTQV